MINLAPTLSDKRDICQNAIDLARWLGIPAPKVALVAAIETINPRMPATVHAATLCKMAERGQIKGGILDGPLTFEHAVSLRAAQSTQILSPVAGNADILVAPDLESGNMLAKELMHLAGGLSAGVVLGAKAPITLTERTTDRHSWMASAALAQVVSDMYVRNAQTLDGP
jgi:phosphate acetyltransferase/phosphate butyryltransferase